MEPTTTQNSKGVHHHFTVDVEEYFQVSAMEPHIPFEKWEGMETRVRSSMDSILALLEEYGSRGTFFVLGWIAERHPEIVRDIAAAGHEVASHGWKHKRVTTLSAEEFRADIRHAKRVLEDLIGEPVLGYRAPSFSIVPGREWALEILVEEGHAYDSSLFPIKRRGYGFPDGKRDPYWIDTPAGRLVELPPTTLRRAGVSIPAAGGAYFRLFPLPIFQAAFRDAGRRGVPGTFYIHPWEFDPDQPRFPVPLSTRVRHYGGLRRTLPRLRIMMEEFRFDTIARTLSYDGDKCTLPVAAR